MKKDTVTTIAKILGADKLLPCVLFGMVLYFLYVSMVPVFTSTNETFKEYISITEKRLLVEERIVTLLEKQLRRSHGE